MLINPVSALCLLAHSTLYTSADGGRQCNSHMLENIMVLGPLHPTPPMMCNISLIRCFMSQKKLYYYYAPNYLVTCTTHSQSSNPKTLGIPGEAGGTEAAGPLSADSSYFKFCRDPALLMVTICFRMRFHLRFNSLFLGPRRQE